MLLQMTSFHGNLTISVAQLPLAFTPPGYLPKEEGTASIDWWHLLMGNWACGAPPVSCSFPLKVSSILCVLFALPGQCILSCKSVLSRRSVLYSTWLQIKVTHFFICFSSAIRNILASAIPRQGKRMLDMGPSSNISTYPCEIIIFIIYVLEMSNIRFNR